MPTRATPTSPRASRATARASPSIRRTGTMAETTQGQKFLKKMDKRDAQKAKEAEQAAKKKEREALALKRKNAPEHPPYKDMIIEAIEALKEPRKGVSAPAIKKYIVGKYKVVEPDHHLKMALRTGVEKETFEMVKMSYKLGPKAPKKKKEKKEEKGEVEKKTSAKKVAGSKGKAAGSTKKAAGSTKKAAGSTKKAAGSKGKAAGSTKKAAGSTKKAAGSKGKAAGSKGKAAGSKGKAAGSKKN